MKLNKTKRIFCLCLAVTLLLLTGCQRNSKNKGYEPEFLIVVEPNKGETDLKFTFDDTVGQFSVKDTRNGKIWANGLTDEYYGKEIENKMHKKNKMSLYSVTYADADGNIYASRNTDASMETTYENNDNKVVANSYISESDISFSVIFELKSNTLEITIPEESIKEENENYKLVTIEMLPFFASSVENEDGYIFYPDGSGTLYEFKNRNASASSTPYKRQVYGDFFCDYDEYISDAESGVKNVMLPVFGVKQGNAAVLAAITNGHADATITLYPFGYIYDAARISVTYNYRYLYEMETVSGQSVLFPEESRSKTDFQIQYTFLANDDANYSGMARTYRSFLLDNGMLNESKNSTTVSLDYLISLKKPELLWSVNVAASSFSDGEELLKNLSEEDISNVKLNLLGWQSEGYNVYPSHFPVSKVSGGASGLKSLIKNAKEYSAIVSIKDNFILAQSTQENEYSRNDLAFSLENKAYIDNNEVNYLFDFRSSKATFENEWIKKALSNNVTAISLDDIARTLYGNGKKSSYLRRSATVGVIQSMLTSAQENFDCVTVSGGNLYGLKYADFLSDIPETSSQDFLFDRDIPFFQMVVHGSLSYAPEIPGNFSNNYEQTILKWVEYGFTPYYSISESSATVIKECYSDGVLVSKFGDVSSTIINTVKRMETIFSNLKEIAIVSHEIKSNGLTEVVYENGSKLLINYSSDKISYSGVTINAQDFIFIK